MNGERNSTDRSQFTTEARRHGEEGTVGTLKSAYRFNSLTQEAVATVDQYFMRARLKRSMSVLRNLSFPPALSLSSKGAFVTLPHTFPRASVPPCLRGQYLILPVSPHLVLGRRGSLP